MFAKFMAIFNSLLTAVTLRDKTEPIVLPYDADWYARELDFEHNAARPNWARIAQLRQELEHIQSGRAVVVTAPCEFVPAATPTLEELQDKLDVLDAEIKLARICDDDDVLCDRLMHARAVVVTKLRKAAGG